MQLGLSLAQIQPKQPSHDGVTAMPEYVLFLMELQGDTSASSTAVGSRCSFRATLKEQTNCLAVRASVLGAVFVP